VHFAEELMEIKLNQETRNAFLEIHLGIYVNIKYIIGIIIIKYSYSKKLPFFLILTS